MASPLDPYFAQAFDLTAYYGETIRMKVMRPAYDQAGTMSTIADDVGMRIDPAGAGTQILNPIPGVSYLVVAGPKALLKAGDLLLPNEDDGATPPVTVVQNIRMSDISGVRTGLVGEIWETSRATQATFENVYFDFVSHAGVSAPVITEFEGSKGLETHRAVVYGRNIKHGSRLVYNGKRYLILAVSGTGNHKLLQLEGDKL